MSANNVVWVMKHISFEGLWHVFYSGCMDNTPTVPDYKDKYYAVFKTKTQALNYASTVLWAIDKEAYDEGFTGVEYGVCIVPKEKIAEPWVQSGIATVLEYDEGLFRIRRYGWEAIISRNDISCMKRSVNQMYFISLKHGKVVEWEKMDSCVDHLKIENEVLERILPTLDALYIASKTVTNKDIQDFVSLVESMVGDLQQELTSKENRILALEEFQKLEVWSIRLNELEETVKVLIQSNNTLNTKVNRKAIYPDPSSEVSREPLVMPQALKDIMTEDIRRYIKNTYIDGHNDGIKRGRILESKENGIRKNRRDGCYQFTYCNECLAYPMGSGCPNLTKGPVELKKPDGKTEKKELCLSHPYRDSGGERDCDGCHLWGQCDHQGAYYKTGKWCYE